VQPALYLSGNHGDEPILCILVITLQFYIKMAEFQRENLRNLVNQGSTTARATSPIRSPACAPPMPPPIQLGVEEALLAGATSAATRPSCTASCASIGAGNQKPTQNVVERFDPIHPETHSGGRTVFHGLSKSRLQAGLGAAGGVFSGVANAR
jgi:hypothetical protein